MALARRSVRVFVVVGDGECNEGSIWEAALCAGKHQLQNLTVIVDYNKRQSYDTVENVQPMEPFADKWASFDFYVHELFDGHDVHLLFNALNRPSLHRPTAIIAHTVKGKGVPEVENHPFWHHKDVFTAEDGARLRAAL